MVYITANRAYQVKIQRYSSSSNNIPVSTTKSETPLKSARSQNEHTDVLCGLNNKEQLIDLQSVPRNDILSLRPWSAAENATLNFKTLDGRLLYVPLASKTKSARCRACAIPGYCKPYMRRTSQRVNSIEVQNAKERRNVEWINAKLLAASSKKEQDGALIVSLTGDLHERALQRQKQVEIIRRHFPEWARRRIKKEALRWALAKKYFDIWLFKTRQRVAERKQLGPHHQSAFIGQQGKSDPMAQAIADLNKLKIESEGGFTGFIFNLIKLRHEIDAAAASAAASTAATSVVTNTGQGEGTQPTDNLPKKSILSTQKKSIASSPKKSVASSSTNISKKSIASSSTNLPKKSTISSTNLPKKSTNDLPKRSATSIHNLSKRSTASAITLQTDRSTNEIAKKSTTSVVRIQTP